MAPRSLFSGFLVLAACSTQPATVSSTTIAPAADSTSPSSSAGEASRPPPDGLPLCASRADVDRLHGKKVRIQAIYDVDPVVRSKRLQAAYLLLPDGTRLLRSYRVVPAELGFLEKRVVVVGTVYRDAGQPPDVQQVMSPHVFPDRIDLAPGETPNPAPPSKRPPPPVVDTAKGLAARKGLWVQAVGKLSRLTTPPNDSTWSEAELTLADGTVVRIPMVYTSNWEPLRGAEVTVIGFVSMGKDIELEEAKACKERVDRCGMEP